MAHHRWNMDCYALILYPIAFDDPILSSAALSTRGQK